MKNLTLIFLALFLINANGFAQKSKNKPSWINFTKRSLAFPEDTYLVGFISEELNPSEDYNEAKDRIKSSARTQLSEGVQLSIKSATSSTTIVEDAEVYSLLSKTSVSLSELRISGLTDDFYYDKKAKIYYALAYAKKNSVVGNYSNSINVKINEIDVNLKKALEYEARDDKQNALKTYFSNLPLFREAEKDISVLVALNGNYKLYSKQISQKKSENEQKIAQLTNSESNTLNDIAFFMAYSLNFQIENKSNEMLLEYFTLSNTNAASEFSRLFKRIFKVKLASTGFDVSTKTSKDYKAPITIKGTYWEDGEMLEIMCSVSDAETGKVLASAENQISKAYLEENNINYKTPNIETVVELQESINSEITEVGGMSIDLFTNKGNENLIFEEGDTLKLYIKSNKECFVRFIYHFADGSKVLLLDNFLVERGDINKLIKISQEFECYPPFGTEVLQLNAQTSPFEALNTKNVQGYEFIEDEIEEIMAVTRGFKPISNEDAKSQKSVIITTLPRE